MNFEEWWKKTVAENPDDYFDEFLGHSSLAEAAWNAALKNQWQPIDSAPKYKPVLTISKNAANRWTIPSVLVWHLGYGWKVCGFPEDRLVYHLPTHWMPLPKPPKEDA